MVCINTYRTKLFKVRLDLLLGQIAIDATDKDLLGASFALRAFRVHRSVLDVVRSGAQHLSVVG